MAPKLNKFIMKKLAGLKVRATEKETIICKQKAGNFGCSRRVFETSPIFLGILGFP